MTENQLTAELKRGEIRSIYYLHGKETFLVETYAKRIEEKCLEESGRDFNFVKFSGNPDISALNDCVQALPVFAERKVVVLNDLDAEKLNADSLSDLLKILQPVDDSACIIISMTGIVPDFKKANTKKLISAIEKHGKNGAVVGFEKLSEVKTAELIVKRAARNGCSVSRENSLYLARLCLRNLTLIAAETDKLCAYADYKGEITRKSIETLTARQLDSGVFALAGEITANRGENSMLLLDELIQQGNPPVVIMSSLAMTFIDFYRAKLGSAAGKRAEQIVKDFGYPANRAWAVGKAMSAVSRLSSPKIRECAAVLCDADYKLKSSPIDDRLIMERAVARLLSLC